MTPAVATHAPGAGRSTVEPSTRRALRLAGCAVLAAIAYVPLLLATPGRVVADTKSYLYLDPGRLLDRASSMWDPNIGMGTVTHQNIGYLFPQGPYYWLTDALGVPAWVAQRFWLGSILFFAALGILYLLRTLHVRGPGVFVAAVVFMLSPYVLDFAARLSVILLPWAGLPWMLALVIRALRDGGWRYPAMFAIVVQVVGSVNATALLFAGIAPALWVPYALFVTREVDVRRAVTTVAKIAGLTILASLWWIAGLSVQGAYGLDILQFTETLETVSRASLPSEVLRGLGYWFLYGGDKISPWVEPSVRYTQDLWLMAVGYAIPLLAFSAAGMIRWRHRAFFVLVAFVGFVVAVGAYDYGDPSGFGRLFKQFADSSDFGFALRSTARAIPLFALGVAVLLGVGVNALIAQSHRPRMRLAGFGVGAIAVALAMANMPSLWDGSVYNESLQRDESIPGYWAAAIADLDTDGTGTRVLEIPGSDFASYRWGGTVDPVTPGLMDRPYVARELVPWGSAATADLLGALDRRLQEGVLEPAAIAPIVRLMSVGDVLYRADLQTDRYNLARAVPTWRLLTEPSTPDGLGEPAGYGSGLGPPLHYTQLDEIALTLPADATEPPPVSVFPVSGTPAIVHTASASAPLVVSGDGEGLVDLATIGALDGRGVVVYSASFARDPAALRAEVRRPGSLLVVTDSNRKRARRWTAIKDVAGPTERTDEVALAEDNFDSRLELFPGAGPEAQSVVDTPAASVSTSHVRNTIQFFPEHRGSRAFDGDVDTAWEVGDDGPVAGDRIRVDLPAPLTTDRVNLVQRVADAPTRFLTRVTLTFDDGDPVSVDLHEASRTEEGETVTFPRRTFERLEIAIDATDKGDPSEYPSSDNVGFAEIRLRDDRPGASDVRVTETVRMPTDLVDAAGAAAARRPLVFVMSRSRNPAIPPRGGQDEEALARTFRVPNARTFALGGVARLASDAPDEMIDAVLGIPGDDAGGITVSASQRLPGDVAARGSSAFDGDSDTAWSTAFGSPAGQWIEVETAAPVTFDRLDLELVADGRHSVPTQVRVDAGGESRTVDLPPVADRASENAVATVPVSFAPLNGDTVRITVLAVRPVLTTEYHDNQPIVMPVAVAEAGLAGVRRAGAPSAITSPCRTDLLTIDGAPQGVRLAGGAARAAAGDPIDLQPCQAVEGAAPVAPTLGKGDHVVRTAPGAATGLDVDRLVLASDEAGRATALGPGGSIADAMKARPATPAPTVEVVGDGRTRRELRVRGATPGMPFWLVLGESINAGWQASAAGKDLGGSRLVDGYANGWLVVPDRTVFDVALEWTPQRRVRLALVVSAAAFLLCLILVVWRRRRGRGEGGSGRPDDAEAGPDDGSAPEPTSPLVAAGRDVGLRSTVVATAAAGLAAAFVASWWVGLVVAACVGAVLIDRRLRGLLTVGAPLCVALTAGYVIFQQHRYDHAYGFYWVEHFDRVTEVAWLAVLLLAADAFVELVRMRRSGVQRAAAPPRPIL